ncbi:MAG: putative metal-binding motif-containing protein, partial [Myxococcales bacterium]|nr:putative metal-binding motif-containing protein [Myxococcales bacterium]
MWTVEITIASVHIPRGGALGRVRRMEAPMTRTMFLLALALPMAAFADPLGVPPPDDMDGDGYLASSDCNDADPTIYPFATEICDYVDQDCDGNADDPFKVQGRYTLEEHCGACDNDCGTYVFDNAAAYCNGVPVVPRCDYTCDAGFFDVNGLRADGCECEYLSSYDIPFDGID